ncbi:tetratricopeptide repeat-containing sulfotransferase family protein [Henriciella marina]|uniref:tetratricopeptide repeat-containing sulfotransferase family protein n=1 Tax=Henriciella marina TaxID=453851 RepID=UPI00036B9B80|nr:tetratricopeptide repeat-containing sulfotransferase family protein [Henriciella marina]
MSDADQMFVAKAKALASEGMISEAIACLESGLASHPAAFDGWMALSKLLYTTRDFSGAVGAARRMENADPFPSEFLRIQRAIETRNFSEAHEIAASMAERVPGHPRAVFTLAHLARARGDHEAAAAYLSGSFDHAPANPVLRELHVSALEDAGDYAGAIEAARQLVQIEESYATLQRLLSVLLRYGLNDEALKACDRAEMLAVDDTAKLIEINMLRGQLHRILGDSDQSVADFKASLAADPRQAVAWWGLADLKTYKFSETEERAIGDLLMSPAGSRAEKCMAAFALAKASEAYGDPERMMAWYGKANSLHAGETFDPVQFSQAIDRLREAFDVGAAQTQADRRADGPTPIFILGLPRSGSTLLEQMLASHSRVEGTMELPVLPSIKRRAHKLCADKYGGDYLGNIGKLSAAELSELGQQYIDDSTVFRAEGADFFIDKLPHNFEHVALIHKILPHATIIDIRRNPMDCGLSLYKQHFATGVGYSYDLGHIGTYYNGYLALMDHWDTVLPGRVKRVIYEDLVASPEKIIRQLLSDIGLGFEADVLNFHQTQRAVRTASSEQVRQPLNSAGIGQWRRVGPHLSRLKESLGADTLRRFEPYLGGAVR